VSSHSSGISGVVSDAERLLPHVTWMGDALWINASNHSNRASLIEDWLKTLNFAEQATAIKSVNGKCLEDGAYYSLNGVKVDKPSKGLYINNGKKIIL